MKVQIYTLPNCGLCKMIKQKMTEANIAFEEHNFEEIAAELYIDRAPVLKIGENIYITSPTEMVSWINEQVR